MGFSLFAPVQWTEGSTYVRLLSNKQLTITKIISLSYPLIMIFLSSQSENNFDIVQSHLLAYIKIVPIDALYFMLFKIFLFLSEEDGLI